MRRCVDQEGKEIDFGVPKILSLIGLSCKAFGGNAGAFRSGGRLQNVKQVDACCTSTVVSFVRSALISLTRTSLRSQNLLRYCSCSARSVTNPCPETRSKVHSARPQID